MEVDVQKKMTHDPCTKISTSHFACTNGSLVVRLNSANRLHRKQLSIALIHRDDAMYLVQFAALPFTPAETRGSTAFHRDFRR